ncbi:uncharacterized protein LOC119458338 isoform X2 [Dermacentor silvarum]|uniref:uncharacterized protein LOC119458338 isoform X2 n=1 Tax=Dermacentor silvarum TaxID=543639 RepID=UPI00210154CE|nr:uncharacterized protein LOC119458338 isoform X2 [Dermacentor silvarum]
MFHGRSPRTRTPYHVCCMAFVKAGSEFWTIVATAALLLLIVLAESDAYSPIRHAVHQGARAQRGPYFSGRGSYSLQVKKSRGGVCHSTNECKEEYCCVERQHVQTCQPYSIFGERCTIPQIRGGGYHDACPCAAGNRYMCCSDHAACSSTNCKAAAEALSSVVKVNSFQRLFSTVFVVVIGY